MGIVNRYPKGFLSLLDSKIGGTTPPQYADFLQPVIDLTPYFLSSFEEAVDGLVDGDAVTPTGYQLMGAPTAAETIFVPADEVWFLWSMTANAGGILGVGVTYNAKPAYDPGGVRPTNPIGVGPTTSFAATTHPMWQSSNFPLGLYCPPHTTFGLHISTATAPDQDNFPMRLQVTKLKQ